MFTNDINQLAIGKLPTLDNIFSYIKCTQKKFSKKKKYTVCHFFYVSRMNRIFQKCHADRHVDLSLFGEIISLN